MPIFPLSLLDELPRSNVAELLARLEHFLESDAELLALLADLPTVRANSCDWFAQISRARGYAVSLRTIHNLEDALPALFERSLRVKTSEHRHRDSNQSSVLTRVPSMRAPFRQGSHHAQFLPHGKDRETLSIVCCLDGRLWQDCDEPSRVIAAECLAEFLDAAPSLTGARRRKLVLAASPTDWRAIPRQLANRVAFAATAITAHAA